MERSRRPVTGLARSRYQTPVQKDLPMGGQTYSLEEALKAQKALRDAAGMAPEQFPLPAFVGMISDEIEQLRDCGKSDEQIASIIRSHSAIEITASEIAKHYASPEERQQHGE